MILREMLIDDLEQVMEIEEGTVSCTLDKGGLFYFSYQRGRDVSCCGRKGTDPGILRAFMVLDEGDVTNVAVRRDRQKEGIGNFLMESLIRLATERAGLLRFIWRFG